eukprot:6922206-Prymnesium_polylepis.1
MPGCSCAVRSMAATNSQTLAAWSRYHTSAKSVSVALICACLAAALAPSIKTDVASSWTGVASAALLLLAAWRLAPLSCAWSQAARFRGSSERHPASCASSVARKSSTWSSSSSSSCATIVVSWFAQAAHSAPPECCALATAAGEAYEHTAAMPAAAMPIGASTDSSSCSH